MNRLLTLTVRPTPGCSPADELDTMHAAFRLLWKRIRRKCGARVVAYVRIVETTNAGTPHFHIALHTPYIAQRWLSDQWYELTGSQVVDIRRIDGGRGVARYLTKYLTKGGEAIAGRRKWSATQGHLAIAAPDRHPDCWLVRQWGWNPKDPDELITIAAVEGLRIDGSRYEWPDRIPPEAA